MQKYQIPENCSNMGPPIVNPEVWRILEKKRHSYDRLLVKIQNLVAAGIVPIIKMTEIMVSICLKLLRSIFQMQLQCLAKYNISYLTYTLYYKAKS